ncbi:MAG: carbohydrate ABC transporter permease [Usitatibacteraceae bacterium]
MAPANTFQLRRFLRQYNLRLIDIPVWLIGLAFAALWIMPFVWMVSTSFKYPGDVMTADIEWFPRRWTFQNYIDIFTKYPIWRWALNSLIVVVSSTVLCVLSGALAAYALARLNFPGKNLLFLVYISSLMVPIEVYAIPMLLGMMKVGWANSYQALILPSVGNVFSVLIFRQFFLNFPRDLEDAARIDGAGHGLIFWKIAMPLARAPLIAATVIVFGLNWNNFFWPLLVTFDDTMKTLPVGIAAFTPVHGTATQLEGYAAAMAGITVLSLPSVVVFLVLQRYFIQGISSGAVRG